MRDPDGSLRKEVLVRDIADFEQRWDEAVDALDNAIELLRHPQEFGAISSQYLPYVSILPAFAALQAAVTTLTAEPPARRAAEDPALVLGQRLHQPLLRLGRVHERA